LEKRFASNPNQNWDISSTASHATAAHTAFEACYKYPRPKTSSKTSSAPAVIDFYTANGAGVRPYPATGSLPTLFLAGEHHRSVICRGVLTKTTLPDSNPAVSYENPTFFSTLYNHDLGIPELAMVWHTFSNSFKDMILTFYYS
jgi:hypothetical protein